MLDLHGARSDMLNSSTSALRHRKLGSWLAAALILAAPSVAHAQQQAAQQPGGPPKMLTGHAQALSGVAFSPGGKIAVTSSYDNTLKLWDVATGRELRTLTGHQQQVFTLAISRDGLSLASGSRDNS